MKNPISVSRVLPKDYENAILVGRVQLPDESGGPAVVTVWQGDVFDISNLAPTCADLMNLPNPLAAVRAAVKTRRIGSVEELLLNSWEPTRDTSKPYFLSPNDIQAVKACGVTFVVSMLERVIEEQSLGDSRKAGVIREKFEAAIGDSIRGLVPGSPQAEKLKAVLIEEGLWSQYLEVGIGEHAEVFTKAQPLSSVGVGAELGVRPDSSWNNPEPEVVLVVNGRGEIVGATLGNDVNLRDFEGRSALLLGEAKDNNASSVVGPLIRLLDERFTLNDVRRLTVRLNVTGDDDFEMAGESSLELISRDIADLVRQATGVTHQYPDGFMLFTGTMFAPTQDREEPGNGFTHKVGDVVSISSDQLGELVNRVSTCDKVAPWTFGVSALMKNLAKRGLI